MTETEAIEWVQHHYGASGFATLTQLVGIVTAEARHQNLIAPSTVPTIWNRHVVDSAQLLALAPASSDAWLDIGSGAGFPGLVVAALSERDVWMVEPRRKRADFLIRSAEALCLGKRVHVVCDHVQNISVGATVISARAVAPLSDLFDWASASATSTTCWLLPKGKSAREDVRVAQHIWHGVFHVEHSITDPDSMIVRASGVVRR